MWFGGGVRARKFCRSHMCAGVHVYRALAGPSSRTRTSLLERHFTSIKDCRALPPGQQDLYRVMSVVN